MKINSPVVREIQYDSDSLKEFNEELKSNPHDRELLLEYPTDYVIYCKEDKKTNKYEVYVGETNSIGRRTLQHLNDNVKVREDWKDLSEKDDARMLIIGHEHFNKSLTMDIENRMIMYLLSVDKVGTLNNRRTNNQNKYYTSDEMESIFSRVWLKLRQKEKDLFPVERVIQDSAIFKASPFHSLTSEQQQAKEKILEKIKHALVTNNTGQLIFVEGEAGSGKTVLLSSLFYTINTELSSRFGGQLHNYLLVNHDQQLTVYQQIATKLGLDHRIADTVSKPTHFINSHADTDAVDIVLVDEAHLLWTQGKQSYQGKNQLSDILKRAKVVVVIFDKHQTLTTEEYWEEDEIDSFRNGAIKHGNLIKLNNQMRMEASSRTISWINSLVYKHEINPIPKDDRQYDLRIFNSPNKLEEAIKRHASDRESKKSGLSRMLATFDWEYVDKKKPEDDEYWCVGVGNWSKPWNLQLNVKGEQKRKNRGLSWAEQPQTINEIGSTYTIQGFDLNYSGVIIGPSVKFRDGKVVFDPQQSHNKKAIRNRTLKDSTKINVAEQLLQNELNVLLTRGVHGLYVYAVDEQLRNALLNAQNKNI